MSQDILEILKVIINQSNIKFDGINYDFDYFYYLHLDKVDNYIVKDFYDQNKEEIKRLLILACGKDIESKYSYCLKWKQFYEVRAILQYKTIILMFLTVLKDLIITKKQILYYSFST